MKSTTRIRFQIVMVFLLGCLVGSMLRGPKFRPRDFLEPSKVAKQLERVYARKLGLDSAQLEALRPEIQRVASEIVVSQRRLAVEHWLLLTSHHMKWESRLDANQFKKLQHWESNMKASLGQGQPLGTLGEQHL